MRGERRYHVVATAENICGGMSRLYSVKRHEVYKNKHRGTAFQPYKYHCLLAVTAGKYNIQ